MTLSCGDAQARMTALLDGELREEEAEAVRRHIDGCAACARIRSECLALRAAVAESSGKTADLWDTVSARIAATETRLMLDEVRLLRVETAELRREIADLRRELARRPSVAGTRSTPLSFPDAPSPARKQYRLV